MNKGTITVNMQSVEEHIQNSIYTIRNEIEKLGTFQEQYDALENFRDELLKYVRWVSPNRKLFWKKCTLTKSGEVLDWHVTGYFAPLDFKRTSWGGIKRTPSEHVIALSEVLKKYGTRLIYVALPCKGVVYPELVVDGSLFREGASTAPQWRKMILEMLESGVEVLDMFPIFQHNKDKPLFSFEHNISPEGAELTAQVIANYITGTSKLGISSAGEFSNYKRFMWYHPWQTNAPEKHVRLHVESYVEKRGVPYLPFENDSNICIFGNCNLQAFQYRGSGIVANLGYQLQREIDNLGRKLIFGSNYWECYDEKAFKRTIEKDIAICISFPSGAFVRTSNIDHRIIQELVRNRSLNGKWSSMNLDYL